MPIHIGERSFSKIILDLDYTVYTKTSELDSRIWDPIEEAQISLLMDIKHLGEDDYESFKKDFHKSGREKGYFATFLEGGGTEKQFEDLTKNVDVSQYLAYDHALSVILYLLSQKVELFIFSGSPLASIDKVLEVLLHSNKDLIKGVWSKEDSAAHGLQKTDPESFDRMFEKFNIKPEEAVLVDDLSRSLAVGKTFGLETVHIEPEQPAKKQGDNLTLPTLRHLMQLMQFS